jgi:hypothetical protein
MVLRLGAPILFLLAALARPALADFKKYDWQFFKAVELDPATSSNYVRFSLDGEVYNQARLSLADLRLLDDQQREIPYALYEAKETTSEEQFTPRIFNQATLPKAYSTLTLDLGKEVYSNRLVLKTPSQNFKRRVEIEGSPDTRKWFLLQRDAYIFDFSGEQKIQLTTINYPQTNYRYLEVRVWNGSERPLDLQGADLFLVKTQIPQRTILPSKPISREEDSKLKATVCLLDLNWRYLPSDFLTIETPEENFSRLVEVQGSNDGRIWQRHLQSEFYRFRTAKYDVEKRTFHFPEARDRFLKVIIYNYDDPPLRLGNFEVQGIAKDVIFQPEPVRQYLLYYGNEQVSAPRYDMDRVKNYLNIDTLARVKLTGENLNREFVPRRPEKPWTEAHPVLFWSVLVLLVLALGGYILSLMSKVGKA